MAESEEKLKSLLMKVKEGSEKAGLKHNIQKPWQIDGETVETVTDITLEGSKITADGDCSHEIKRRLRLGRKAVTNLDSLLKSRDITTKVRLVKVMVFPVVRVRPIGRPVHRIVRSKSACRLPYPVLCPGNCSA